MTNHQDRIPKVESWIESNDIKNEHTLIYKITFKEEFYAVALQKIMNKSLKVEVLDKYHGDSKYE